MTILDFNQFLNEERSPLKSRAAGIVLLYDNKILLVHPTGSTWVRGTCGIPKGGMEENENPLDAAIRELEEETGIAISPDQLDPSPETVEIYNSKGHLSRQLTYFVCKIRDLSEIGLTSEKIPANQLQKEEIDWAKFVTAKEAYPITCRSQLIILDRHIAL